MKGIVYKEQKIDSKDKEIMKALFENGRMSIADIAKRTKLRRDTVARRLQTLQKEDIITGFVPIINPPALGYPNISLLLIRLKTGKEENLQKFQQNLVTNKYTIHISKLIGKYNYFTVVVYENINHLNKILEDIKKIIPDFIEDIEVIQVVEEPKFENMSGLL